MERHYKLYSKNNKNLANILPKNLFTDAKLTSVHTFIHKGIADRDLTYTKLIEQGYIFAGYVKASLGIALLVKPTEKLKESFLHETGTPLDSISFEKNRNKKIGGLLIHLNSKKSSDLDKLMIRIVGRCSTRELSDYQFEAEFVGECLPSKYAEYYKSIIASPNYEMKPALYNQTLAGVAKSMWTAIAFKTKDRLLLEVTDRGERDEFYKDEFKLLYLKSRFNIEFNTLPNAH